MQDNVVEFLTKEFRNKRNEGQNKNRQATWPTEY